MRHAQPAAGGSGYEFESGGEEGIGGTREVPRGGAFVLWAWVGGGGMEIGRASCRERVSDQV